MPFLELINDINDAWSKISYGVTPEGSLQAGDSPREFKIDKLQLTIVDEEDGLDYDDMSYSSLDIDYTTQS